MEAGLGAAAERFWAAAGGLEPFPRRLEDTVTLTLPVDIVRLPRLRLAVVERWLARRGSPWRWGERDRPLRACLAAARERGTILLEADDPPEEQRYSLAHEVAHFLPDYQAPRRAVAGRLGPTAVEVLDGRRAPTSEERLDAALAGLQLEAHLHLLERGERGVERGTVAEAELRADRLALELLAPWREALAALPATGPRAQRRASAVPLLAAAFGLPALLAADYACRLLDERDGPAGWSDLLAPAGGGR